MLAAPRRSFQITSAGNNSIPPSIPGTQKVLMSQMGKPSGGTQPRAFVTNHPIATPIIPPPKNPAIASRQPMEA